jgi:WD40-like Beta Propeller Repeat
VATLTPPSTQQPSDSELEQLVIDRELLVREARARQRRRRLRLVAALLAAVAVGGIIYGAIGRGGSRAAGVEAIPNGLVVNVRAFEHHGSLAFLSRGSLWLLDGERRTLRRIAEPHGRFTPAAPTFSPDGKWLAYLKTRSGLSYSQLWIARADGSNARVVPNLQAVSLYGWSPSSDVLAVGAGPKRTKQPCPCGVPTTLRLVSPGGDIRTLARSSWIYGAAWSPNGKSIAASEVSYPLSKLVVYPAAGGPGTTWLAIGDHQRLNGQNGVLFQLAGWWRKVGIGAWVFDDGAIRDLDATPLDVVSSPGARPRLLGETLSDGGTDAIAPSGDGKLAIVTDHGGGRAAWQDKEVDLCSPASCQTLAHTPRTVTVDPAWSSDGKTVAYVQAPNVRVGPWTQTRVAAWFAAHRVLLYDTTTGRTRSIPAAHGATAINWSANDRSLLYVRGDAIWLMPTLAGKPVRIATPLYPPRRWPQYYAEIDWAGQFAWTSR